MLISHVGVDIRIIAEETAVATSFSSKLYCFFFVVVVIYPETAVNLSLPASFVRLFASHSGVL